MENKYNRHDLEKIALVAHAREIAARNTVEDEQEVTEQEVRDILTMEQGVSAELADRVLQDYKNGAISANEKQLIRTADAGNSARGYIAASASQFLERIQNSSNYLVNWVNRKAKTIAITASVGAAVGILASPIEQWWNATDYALEALSKYEAPVKIRTVEEREEILYWLDEIIEEYGNDDESDDSASLYFQKIERSGFSIKEAAEVLNLVGRKSDRIQFLNTHLGKASLEYLEFLKRKNVSSSDAGFYLDLAREEIGYNNAPKMVKKALELYLEDHPSQ